MAATISETQRAAIESVIQPATVRNDVRDGEITRANAAQTAHALVGFFGTVDLPFGSEDLKCYFLDLIEQHEASR